MHKKWTYIWRIIQVICLVAVGLFLTFQVIILLLTSNEIKYQQSEKFSYSLTNLAAAEATRYLANNKIQDLALLIDDLSNDPIVRDVTIYNHLGQVIAQSENTLSLLKLLNIGFTNSKAAKGKIPYIAELYKENEKIGYIRITLEQQKILRVIHDYQEKSLDTLWQLLILSFAAGAILMTLFFKRAEKIYLIFVNQLRNTIQKNKAKSPNNV